MRQAQLLPGLLALTLATATLADEKDTARVVRLTTELETAPNGAGAKDARRWLMTWVEQTPDYSVSVCNILGPIPGKAVPNGPELLGQYIFGNVAYQIQQGAGTDPLSRQVAGFRSLLRAYAALLAADPAARIPYMDTFLTAENQGELRDKLAPLVAKACK